MAFLSGLLTLIKTLPALMKVIQELSGWMRDTFGEKPEEYLLGVAESFKQVREAKTPDEKREAAAKIATLIRRM